MGDLRVEDQTSFMNFLLLLPEKFDELLECVGPKIAKRNTAV